MHPPESANIRHPLPIQTHKPRILQKHPRHNPSSAPASSSLYGFNRKQRTERNKQSYPPFSKTCDSTLSPYTQSFLQERRGFPRHTNPHGRRCMRRIGRSDPLEWGRSAPRAVRGRSTCDEVKGLELVCRGGRKGGGGFGKKKQEGTREKNKKNKPFRIRCCFEHQRVGRDQTFEAT